MKLPDRIPPLAGPVRAVYRVVGALLILLTLLAGTVGQYQVDVGNARSAQAFYGAGVRNTMVGRDAIGVTAFSDEARAAGLPTGELLAVDGVDVRGDNDRRAKTTAALEGPEGSIVTLRVAVPAGDPEATVRDYRLTRSADHLRKAYAGSGLTFAAREQVRLVLDLAASLMVTALMALLWLRRPRDPVAALFVVGGTALTINPLPFIFAWIPAWLTPVSYVVGMSAVHAGLILFPSASLRPRWVLAAIAAVVVLALAPVLFTPLWVMPLSVTLESLITLAVIVTRFRAAEPGIERQQIKWAALGLAAFAFFFFVQAMLTFSLEGAPSEGVRAWFILLAILAANLAVFSLAGGVLVALLRFRLYDAEAAISRSAVLASLTLVLLGIFTAAEKAIESIGQSWFGASLGGLSGAAAATLAAITIAPLHARLTRWSENKFQKDLNELRRRLPDVVADLRETATTRELADEVLQRVATILRATVGSVVVGDEPAALRELTPEAFAEWRSAWTQPDGSHVVDKDDPLLPVRIPLRADACGRVGWLLLGRRPDGSLYGKDEREVLAEIADPVARGLAITQRREAETSAARAVSERIEARMASLEALIERSLGGEEQTRAKKR